MYYLRGDRTHWSIDHTGHHKFYGSLDQTIRHAKVVLKIKEKIIDEALDYMVWLCCDVAKFDDEGKFLHVYKSKECMAEQEAIIRKRNSKGYRSGIN